MTRITLLSRRSFCLAVAASATAGCAAPAATGAGSGSGPVPPTTGKLLLAKDGKFFMYDLATRQEAGFGHFPKGAFASSPALSPDRKLIAYAFYVVPKDPNDAGGNDLYVMETTAKDARLVRSHANPKGSYEDPVWAADGTALFATLRAPLVVAGQVKGETTTIVLVPLNGGPPTMVVTGDSPTASPDGKYLAYLSTDSRARRHFWIANTDGSGARELVANQGFTTFRAPRFSPDSQLLVFAAAGGPAKPVASTRSTPNGLARLLAPAIAEADGIPMDLWTIRSNGSGLRQVPHVEDHSPVPAWSPDGKWVALAGELSLTIVDPSGKTSVQLLKDPLLSGIVWLS